MSEDAVGSYAECGMRSVECGARNAECGVRKTGHNDGARLDMVSNTRIEAIARRDATAL